MEHAALTIISEGADIAGTIAGVLGAVMIFVGVVVALARFLGDVFRRNEKRDKHAVERKLDPIRVEFGRYINFGLEFFIAADVLETMFLPTWNEIGQLFALVVIRTVISYFLIYEIHKIEGQH